MGRHAARPPRDPVAALAPVIEVLTGRPHTSGELARFRQYLNLLLAWNRIHRLTGLRSADAIVRELFRDSLLFLARLPSGPLRIVDLGTGPGIPGVPLKIVRAEIALTLIDSRRKQVSFLSALKRELGLSDLVVLEGRAEELAAQHPDLVGGFDVVVTRAVGGALLPTGMRYLKPGGLFVAGGSPTMKAGTRIGGPISADWETIAFDRLGLSRTLLLSRKSA